MKNIFVDVDDTLIRSEGKKRIPILENITKIIDLKAAGHRLFCWSSGGADYAQAVTEELGIARIFEVFLPKPHLIIDDQPFLGKVIDPKDLDPAKI